MEYSIRELVHLAGINTRTLRYYDEIGLLKPCNVNENGMRFYGQQEVTLLQQIMFYNNRITLWWSFFILNAPTLLLSVTAVIAVTKVAKPKTLLTLSFENMVYYYYMLKNFT